VYHFSSREDFYFRSFISGVLRTFVSGKSCTKSKTFISWSLSPHSMPSEHGKGRLQVLFENEKENTKFHHVHLKEVLYVLSVPKQLLLLSTLVLKHFLHMCYKYGGYMGLSHPSLCSTVALK
jgi:hypothetical protein